MNENEREPVALTPEETLRYHRQIILPQVGPHGQEQLKNASILLVGVGGLGSPAALYLAAAGIGRLGVVDADVVELSNLQRQVLHDTPSVGRSKTESATVASHASTPMSMYRSTRSVSPRTML